MAGLPRTLVNRLWARFFGRGLVEPVDDMEQPAWNPDLLDWLAEDFVAHHYDVKHTIACMLTSRAYQLPAVNLVESKGLFFVDPACGGCRPNSFGTPSGRSPASGSRKPSSETEPIKSAPASWRLIR